MTEAQQQARVKALQILSEHFNAAVLVTMNDYEVGENPDENEEINTAWHGGYSTCRGLLAGGPASMERTVIAPKQAE